jgi:hypothetical protein
MAREVIIRIRDDFDAESLADKTVPFSYCGTSYEIDLTATNADEFDAVMARYIGAGRVVEPEVSAPRRKRRAPGAPKPVPENVAQRRRIREWAAETGYQIQEKGMIGADIIRAYAATHSDDPIRRDTWMRLPRRGKRAAGAASVTAQQGNDMSAADFMAGSARPVAEVAKAQAIPDKALRDKIRQWARDNGYHVNSHGFLPREVVAAYDAAHSRGGRVSRG